MSNARLGGRALFRRRLIALSVAACFTFSSTYSAANPVGGVTSSGSASFSTSGNTLTVTNSANAIINWQSFSIGVNEITRFVQPSVSSAVLNRVTGANGVIPQSVIDGVLSSNGRVFLLNSSGIAIGANARIDVAGFVASSLNLSDADFLAGKMRFTETAGAGKVSNAGTIDTTSGGPGGRVFLVGSDVQNSGIIRTPQGEIVLAAGKTVDLVAENSPFVTVSITADSERALNLGQLIADSGRIGMYGALVRQSGVAQASAAVAGENGEIRLVATQNLTLDAGSVTSASGGAQGGNVQVSAPVVVQAGDIRADGDAGGSIQIDAGNFLQAGTLSASGSIGAGGTIAVTAPHVIQTASAVMAADGADGKGGSIAVDASGAADGLLFSSARYSATGDTGGDIKLLGHDIVLLGAAADASGRNGGGSILVGGDLHGANAAVANAATTGVNFSTTLKADATQNGDGGKIVVWSDNNTQFYGRASARGGAQSGNGGFMEISGRDSLAMGGFADAGARYGVAGTVLLDPKNIIIDANATAGTLGSFQLVDPHPGANEQFGTQVKVLPNQNVVVTDPNDSFGGGIGAGAVYLFNSSSGALMSALTGSSANDHVGSGPITPLPAGSNFVVQSPSWSNTGAASAGAVTFVNGLTGLSGTVSAGNSLVGTTANDQVGSGGVTPLFVNNAYVVSSPNWNNLNGAVTWVNGTNGNIAGTVSAGGAVSPTNSLVNANNATTASFINVIELPNGNYVVANAGWGAVSAGFGPGAVTLVNGTNGNIAGTPAPGGSVSGTISLVGGQQGDGVGSEVQQVGASNYVVLSTNWNAQTGAITFGDGTLGVVGPVSASNSLVGTTPGDQIGFAGVVGVGNGANYVVLSPRWNGGMGAVTFGSGTTGVAGQVGSTNSLVGTSATDQVGNFGSVIELSNGNYLVATPNWTDTTNGVGFVGAVTFGPGTAGVAGPINASNSLVGTSLNDHVGSTVIQLTNGLSNGNYVVISPTWTNNSATPAGAAGAVTWGSGTSGVKGTVSSGNSLVGTTANDEVGSNSITQLSNGAYVVSSPNWTQPVGAAPVSQVGAATWVDGTNGNIFGTTSPGGAVSTANSLVGVTQFDVIGNGQIKTLPNGNYVVISPSWSNATGAVTFAPGSGAAGPVTSANSLVGSLVNDGVGSNGIVTLANSNYLVLSPQWNGTMGAVTFVNGTNGNVAGTGGPGTAVSSSNSLVGSTAGDAVGSGSVLALPSGNYVVASPNWTNIELPTPAALAGAVTFGNVTTGTVGPVSSSNSLVGTNANDQVGNFGAFQLGSNYLVLSTVWNNSAGAVTFGSGTAGVVGAVSAANSLVGANAGDQVGGGFFIPLPNFDYVVRSPNWNGGMGAVTFGSGTTGIAGQVSSANSLIGSTPDTTSTGDHIGSGGVLPLSGGNYLVVSPQWNNTTTGATQAGAVTWVNGSNGDAFGQTTPGAAVSASNSLVGGTTGDQVGFRNTDCSSNCGGFTGLFGGNLALSIPFWTNPATTAAGAGAVTFINTATGLAGLVSSANSIVGAAAGDNVGGGTFSAGIIPLINGNFIVTSPHAANGLLPNAGLVQVATVPGAGGGAPATGQTFSANPSSDVTITPASITAITNTGTALVLQANNDLTLNANSDITTQASGLGGSITLQAGRSVILNSSLSTDNGAVNVVANESATNGVIDANRDPGAAVIAMAPGTIIKAGNANISLTLNDGAGLTNSTSGNITLGSLTTTGAVQVQNLGPTAGSGIVRSDAAQLVSAGSAAFVVNGAGGGGGIGTLAAPIRVRLANLAAQTQIGGAFFDSPLQGLTIGTAGNLNGIAAVGAGDIGVSAAGPISIAQLVNSGTGAIKLASTATLSESGAGLISTGGTLTTVSAGGATLGGANTVAAFNATNTAGGDVLFTNAAALAVTGVSEAGGNVTLSTTGAMTLAGAVSAGAGSVTLASTGAINGSPSGSVQGGLVALNATGGAIGSGATPLEVITPTLSAVAANGIAIDLNGASPQPATVNTLQNTATGDIVLNTHGGATFTTPVSNPGGSVTINSFSPLDVTAGITAGNSIFLSTSGGSGAANDMSLAGTYTYNTLTGAFEVKIGLGGKLTLFTGTPPLVLTAPLFPNPVDITKFTFVHDVLSDPDVALAYNTTLEYPVLKPKFNLGDEKKEKQDKAKKEAAACK